MSYVAVGDVTDANAVSVIRGGVADAKAAATVAGAQGGGASSSDVPNWLYGLIGVAALAGAVMYFRARRKRAS